jgi:hypothetical protein
MTSIAQRFFTWILPLMCLLFGIYWAADHTLMIFSPHNYLLGPLGDDGMDAVNIVYPYLQKTKSIKHLFAPYGDHRLILSRIQTLLEYFFTNGTQVLQPIRISLLLWLDSLLIIYYLILPNTKLAAIAKILLSGMVFIFLFANVTTMNYGSTYMTTWPWIIAISIILFNILHNYCSAVAQNASRLKVYFYLFLIALLVNIGFYTFSIGTMLWPIVFIVLFKTLFVAPSSKLSLAVQKNISAETIHFGALLAYRTPTSYYLLKHLSVLALLAFISYVVYFLIDPIFIITTLNSQRMWLILGQHAESVFGAKFLYLTRMLSFPIIKSTAREASVASTLLGSLFLFLSFKYLRILFKQPAWTKLESMLFALFSFNLIAVLLIAIGRGNSPAEAFSVARFSTPVFMLLSCLFITGFMYPPLKSSVKKIPAFIFNSVVAMYAVVFVQHDLWFSPTPYDMSAWNQFLIAESIGAPINEAFGKAIGQMQNLTDPAALSYLNTVQKQNHKGAYSLWMSGYVNRSINELPFTHVTCQQAWMTLQKAPLFSTAFLTVTLPQPKSAALSRADILFTKADGQMVGYGLRAISMENPLRWLMTSHSVYSWKGAVNMEQLTNNSSIVAWAVDKEARVMCRIGETRV